MNTSKPDTTTETTSTNKGQRTNNKNNEQYQTPKKKHDVKEQNNIRTRRAIKTPFMLF
jgi:hypothetical protein